MGFLPVDHGSVTPSVRLRLPRMRTPDPFRPFKAVLIQRQVSEWSSRPVCLFRGSRSAELPLAYCATEVSYALHTGHWLENH